MKQFITILICALCMSSTAHVLDNNIAITEPLAESDTDEEYHRYEILGWTVHVSAEDASDQPEKTENALWYMRSKLQTIIEVLPLNKVKLLRRVEFWINDDWEEDDEICGIACYVPENYYGVDFYEDRAGAVIFRDMDYIRDTAWCCAGSAVLHELAHAYHDQFLEDGFSNSEIEDVFEDAKDSGDYDSNQVMYPWWDDQYVEHYGMTNAREFYATMTQTFFLKYYTYPHTVRDLYKHDRSAYWLIVDSWYSNDINGDVVVFSETTSPPTFLPKLPEQPTIPD